MRTAFIDCLMQQARIDQRIFLITPDVGFSVLERFRDEFPDRFLNVGIAEQNAVGVAAGLALSGMRAYVYSMVPFVTMRCFEQVRIDVAYQQANVVLVGIGGGLPYGPAGATHHSIEDIAIMRALPNMTVCAPGDPFEARTIIRHSFTHNGPIYLRLGKNGEPTIHHNDTPFPIGTALQLTEGDEIALVTSGTMLELAMLATRTLQAEGRAVRLISMPTLKPFDTAAILALATGGIPIVTLEEHSIIGGLGSAVAEVIAESGQGVRFKRIALPDAYSHTVGGHEYLRNHFGLNLERVLDACRTL